jgi:hypothetical protein
LAIYLDSTAIVKLVVREAESGALRRWLRTHARRATSVLARVEVLRAVRAHGDRAVARARKVLARIVQVSIDDQVLAGAADLDVPGLRSLDAIHLATAKRLGSDLQLVVTYDERMAAAAASLGIKITAPT